LGSSLTDATPLKVTAEGLDDAEFPISWGPFIVPSLSSSDGRHLEITVATPQDYRSSALEADMSVKIVSPVPQSLTLGPKLIQSIVTLTDQPGTSDDYVLSTGSYDVGQTVTGAISLSLLQGDTIIDTLLLGAGVAAW
jgi:hypothetical protein